MDSICAVENFRKPERWNSVPIPERVALRAVTNVDVQPDGCWISRYSVASHGYSQIGWNKPGDRADRHVVLGHRAAWVSVNGQVPLGMTIDHICKVRRCVNPDHLRLLPNYENARRTHGRDWPMGYCANGHDSTHLETATRASAAGGTSTRCKTCTQASRQRYQDRKKAEKMQTKGTP
jgi:hypothetical protein